MHSQEFCVYVIDVEGIELWYEDNDIILGRKEGR